MSQFTIEKFVANNYSHQRVEFRAIDNNGRSIFGSTVTVSRFRLYPNTWDEWEMNWSCSGAKTYKNSLPFVATINRAMEFLSKAK